VNFETVMTLKRIGTLLMSMAVIVFYGYALGGLGGYLFGQGRPFTIAWGLSGGSVLAYAALRLWQSYLRDVDSAAGRDEGDGVSPPEAR
jgi:hypothetical protein